MTETVDGARVEAFVGKVLTDTAGAGITLLGAVGDKLGLFKDLAASGPATSAELARRTGISERYAREWLGAMAAAGYLEYAASGEKFTLPAEHAPALAQEAGPAFFGGVYEMFTGMISVFDRLPEAFRTGAGVPQSAYPEQTYDGMDRFTAGWFENLLLQEWIPAVPHVEAALGKGISVADVGCGRGRALVKLAQAFPASTYTGFDIYGPNVEKARANAKAAGVEDRVKFVEADVSKSLPDTYDLISTFDVVHDAADPAGLLRVIRESLKPGGSYLCLDINCSDKLEENLGPLGAFFHVASIFYCMTTSLAGGGAALGTLGLHEHKLGELAKEAGFKTVRRLPLENAFNNLYELQA